MFGQRKKINLPDATRMKKALEAIRAVQNDHDARIMLLVFLDRAVLMARNLKAHGIETDESLETLFRSAHQQTKRPLDKKPPSFNPDVSAEKAS
jgi:hypothetical protein